MKILVLGDAFVDTYHLGTTSRLSAEAPIPVVNITGVLEFPGGACNVRENLISLGVDGRYLFQPTSRKVNYPVKNRLIVNDTQVARWDTDDWCSMYQREDLLVLMEDFDAVIVSDYGKGSITKEVIQILWEVTLPVFVDTKQSPVDWIGSEAVLFPNLEEYKRYQKEYDWIGRVVLKRGAEGLSLLEFGSVVLQRPAVARFVRDVNGAGDTVIAAFALALVGGRNIDWCLEFANAAAAVAVEHQFTYAPSLREVEYKLYQE